MTTEANQNTPAPATAPEADNTTPLVLDAPPTPSPPSVPPAPAAPAEGEVFEFEPTGDVGLDMALAFIGKAGISEDHPAMQAAVNGDFSILKATLASKGVQGWEQFVALGEAAHSRKAAEAQAQRAKLQEAVFQEAGGKEQWLAVQKWASANATAEEKAEINALLNKGGLAAKGAVKYLVDVYSRANNVEVNPRDATANASRGGVPADDNEPLSPRAYAKAVQELNVQLRGRLEGSKEYANLQRRRQAFRG